MKRLHTGMKQLHLGAQTKQLHMAPSSPPRPPYHLVQTNRQPRPNSGGMQEIFALAPVWGQQTERQRFVGTSQQEVAEASAAAAFASNDVIINEHNAKGLSYWLGYNEFSDMTWEEGRNLSPSTSATPTARQGRPS